MSDDVNSKHMDDAEWEIVSRVKENDPRPTKYILDEAGEPVPCEDYSSREAWLKSLMKWAQWMEADDHRIVKAQTVNGLRVSTVFLGIDCRHFGEGPPILWETMIFDERPDGSRSELDYYQDRYASKADAIAGHTRAVDYCLAKLPEARVVSDESGER